ncbi:MAG: tRNA (guanosine(37)-N1)-methyltransferase TrmD [Alphaproteobacteria bacterium]|nr:tRNA (guanosine(37)-N1)-methyltransferase TrmD [Alphaproteobacteria bacterium]
MTAPWSAWVLTLFPEMFPGPLAHTLAGKALADGLFALHTVAIRDFAHDRHRTVDDTPFGGGPGMVMRADVLAEALEATAAAARATLGAETCPIVYLTPRGRPLDQERVRALARAPGVILICGRYEGIDQRVIEAHPIEEVSLGDFVLSGGEPAALALIDAVVRLLPGVVGQADSLSDESFETGLLEYPHYTRPRVWQGRSVPEVLLSGHHENIVAWRRTESERITAERRTDLWQRYQQKTRIER